MAWYMEKVVPFPQIKTVNQAMAYVHAEYKVSLRDCPSASAEYKKVRDQVEAGIVGLLGQPLIPYGLDILQSKLSVPRNICSSERGMIPSPNIPPLEAQTLAQKPPGSAAAVDITNGIQKAGIPWWVWVLGGGVVYLLLKKGKK